MKKIFCFIGISILLFSVALSVFAGSVPEDLLHNDGAYEKAEGERMDTFNADLAAEGEEVSLSALFGVDKMKCDKIEFAVFGRQQNYEIDKEKFWNLADEILLKSINNTLVSSENSFVICAFLGDEVHTVTVWDNCKVGSKKTRMYSAPLGDYIIKSADYEKLIGLFPIEAQPNLPKIKSAYANFVYWAIDHPTMMYTIGAIIIIVFVGGIGFLIRHIIRERKAGR